MSGNKRARKGEDADRSRRLETVVSDLRDLSERVRLLGGRVYFPSKDPNETRPVALEGYVDMGQLGEMVHYLADMLEE